MIAVPAAAGTRFILVATDRPSPPARGRAPVGHPDSASGHCTPNINEPPHLTSYRQSPVPDVEIRSKGCALVQVYTVANERSSGSATTPRKQRFTGVRLSGTVTLREAGRNLLDARLRGCGRAGTVRIPSQGASSTASFAPAIAGVIGALHGTETLISALSNGTHIIRSSAGLALGEVLFLHICRQIIHLGHRPQDARHDHRILPQFRQGEPLPPGVVVGRLAALLSPASFRPPSETLFRL